MSRIGLEHSTPPPLLKHMILAGHLARRMGNRFHDHKQGESAWTIQTFS